jgi:hypothetical protein
MTASCLLGADTNETDDQVLKHMRDRHGVHAATACRLARNSHMVAQTFLVVTATWTRTCDLQYSGVHQQRRDMEGTAETSAHVQR